MQSIEDILPTNMIIVKKNITLVEVCSGGYKTEEIERKILCPTCYGVGSDDGILRACKKCRGRRILSSIDNNNIQIRLCEFCSGIGIDSKLHKCKTCNGIRVVNEKHMIKYLIPIGVKHNEEIIIKQQGNINIGNNTHDDIKIIINILEDDKYKTIYTKSNNTNIDDISDTDLIISLDIPLVNALCGIKKKLNHPSGNTIMYETSNILTVDNISIIDNCGLPEKNNKNKKGKLYIKTKIIFPEFLNETMKNKVFEALQIYNENDL